MGSTSELAPPANRFGVSNGLFSGTLGFQLTPFFRRSQTGRAESQEVVQFIDYFVASAMS